MSKIKQFILEDLKYRGEVGFWTAKAANEIYSMISNRGGTKNAIDRKYQRVFGRKVDWDNPKTLNEKIQWLKFNTYYKNPLVTQCADKYAVPGYQTC